MTTQPVGTRRPASLPGGVTGYAGQPVGFPLSRRGRRGPLHLPGIPVGRGNAGQVSYER